MSAGPCAVPHVAVVGGGWAGCSAALTLAEAGVRVTLYESGKGLGGRARGVELAGHALDNGQHILLGAYTTTLDLIARLAAGEPTTWRYPLALHQPPEFGLSCPRLPAPLHLLAGLLSAHGLDWSEKWAALRWARTVLQNAAEVEGTVAHLTRAQPERLNRLLWHPLCVSALNTPPEVASARVFRAVLRAAFAHRARDSDLVLPRRDLSMLLPAPAAARVTALGGSVLTASRVLGLRAASDSVTLRLISGPASFSHVVLATAPQHVGGLVESVAELDAVRHALQAYRYQSIATAYVQYAADFSLPHPLLALAGGPAQFVFDRGQSHGQAGLMAFVASAAAVSAPAWTEAAEAQLARVAAPGNAQWRKAIVEKQATYSCEPDMCRPTVYTAHPRIFLAGDFTAGPYPATLEGATQSGVQSARALLERL